MPHLKDLVTDVTIRAMRNNFNDQIEIPKGSRLNDVRTSDKQAWERPIPECIREIVRRGNENIWIFEYGGETLFMAAGDNLCSMSHPYNPEQ